MQDLDELFHQGTDAELAQCFRERYAVWLKSTTRSSRGADGKLRRAFRLTLNQALGLPVNPEKLTTRWRNRYLRQAAMHLACDPAGPWTRARLLHQEVRRFMGHRWLCWGGMAAPPPDASDLDHLLFHAAKCGGGALPKSERQYRNILQD